MDFTTRNTQSQASQPAANSSPASAPSPRSSKSAPKTNKWWQISGLVLLFSVTILAVAAIAILAFGTSSQTRFVNNKKYQAVFLTNGQVYFGNIKQMGDDYLRLQNIYYLQNNNSSTPTSTSSTTSNSYTLVQLGCQQVHDPYNEMIINRDQVSFWENLQDSGQVVQQINQFKKQFPNGPDCSKVSSQTQASGSNTQGSGSNSSSPSSSSSSSNNSTTKNP
jgi:hypothetical protein